MQLHYRSDKLPACRWQLARISHKRSAALREIGTGVTSTRFATLQGVRLSQRWFTTGRGTKRPRLFEALQILDRFPRGADGVIPLFL